MPHSMLPTKPRQPEPSAAVSTVFLLGRKAPSPRRLSAPILDPQHNLHLYLLFVGIRPRESSLSFSPRITCWTLAWPHGSPNLPAVSGFERVTQSVCQPRLSGHRRSSSSSKTPGTSAGSSLCVIMKKTEAQEGQREPTAGQTERPWEPPAASGAAVLDFQGIQLTDPALFAKDEMEKPKAQRRESTHCKTPTCKFRKHRVEIPQISFQSKMKCYLDFRPKR